MVRTYARLAAALLAAASALGSPRPFDTTPPPESPLGWTNGKLCSQANNCDKKATVSACLDCCSHFCPGPTIELECFDTCVPEEPKAIAELRKAHAGIQAGDYTAANITTLRGGQGSNRSLVRRIAAGLAKESALMPAVVVPSAQHADPGRAS